jgi:hypothetical protein
MQGTFPLGSEVAYINSLSLTCAINTDNTAAVVQCEGYTQDPQMDTSDLSHQKQAFGSKEKDGR